MSCMNFIGRVDFKTQSRHPGRRMPWHADVGFFYTEVEAFRTSCSGRVRGNSCASLAIGLQCIESTVNLPTRGHWLGTCKRPRVALDVSVFFTV